MRVELKNLKLVVDKSKKKTKKGIRKKPKTNKKKTKREKDLTADRSLQSLGEELILEGFLIQPMNIKLSDGIGSQAVLMEVPDGKDSVAYRPVWSWQDVGSRHQTGAHLFHLSTRYPSQGGAAYLLHLIFKVAGGLQPSVIWIEDTEKTFYRKTLKSDRKFDPQRLKKNLLKSLKTLKLEDQIPVTGTSLRPFDGDIKPFCKVYKRIIMMPDYSSRLGLVQKTPLGRRKTRAAETNEEAGGKAGRKKTKTGIKKVKSDEPD